MYKGVEKFFKFVCTYDIIKKYVLQNYHLFLNYLLN
jgi:hypothetical protein